EPVLQLHGLCANGVDGADAFAIAQHLVGSTRDLAAPVLGLDVEEPARPDEHVVEVLALPQVEPVEDVPLAPELIQDGADEPFAVEAPRVLEPVAANAVHVAFHEPRPASTS